MPSKQRRVTMKNRQRRRKTKTTTTTQESYLQLIYLRALYEKNLEKCDSDIRTIPDQTFGKVYSTQIESQSELIEERPSSNASSIRESEILASPLEKSIKKKRNIRKRS